jgi:hypothetical protein
MRLVLACLESDGAMIISPVHRPKGEPHLSRSAGNLGDGQTHLLRRLQDVIGKVSAVVVPDATAEKQYEGTVRRCTAVRRVADEAADA